MAIKFLEEKENKEAILYLIIFVLVLFGLIRFVGIDISFKKQEVAFKERNDFSKIETALKEIEASYDFENLRPFELIPPHTGPFGRDNPFQAQGMSAYLNEGRQEEVSESPEEEVEEPSENEEEVTEEEEE